MVVDYHAKELVSLMNMYRVNRLVIFKAAVTHVARICRVLGMEQVREGGREGGHRMQVRVGIGSR